MGLLLAFAPFIAFALIDRLAGPVEGLVAGAIVSAALTLRETIGAHRSPKILDIGTLVLFAGLALYAVAADPGWSAIDVRLRVDVGLLAIILLTLALRRPFTLQYARERTPPEIWTSPTFIRTNYVISAVWALAFVVVVLADLALLYAPTTHPGLSIAAIVIALVAAFKFTGWYPAKVRRRVGP